MVQAKLPDLNHYWFRYHESGAQSLLNRNYEGAMSAIYNMNALLPDEYRLDIDTDKYNQLTTNKLSVICGNCDMEIDRDDIKIFDALLPFIDQCVTQNKFYKAWFCSKCNKVNNFSKTKLIEDSHEQPYYFKVIPEPPTPKGAFRSRFGYHEKFVKWYYDSLEELDHQLGLYRKEYEPEDMRDDVAEDFEDAD